MFGGFRRFWRVWYLCKPIESYAAALALGGLGPGVPVGEVALALGCLLGTVLGGFGPAGDGVWRVWTFWRVWTVLEGVWRVWKVLEVWGVWRVLEGVWRV